MINTRKEERPDFFIEASDFESDGNSLKLDIVLWAYSINQAERRAEAVARAQQGALEVFLPKTFIALNSERVNPKARNARKKYSVTIVNERWIRNKLS